MIPVASSEAEPIYFFVEKPGHPQIVVVTEDGTVLRGRKGARTDNGITKVLGWESHFSSCPGRSHK